MSTEGEDARGYFAPSGPSVPVGPGTEALVRALARNALRNTPAVRAAELARALARALAKRGPLPTHRPAGGKKLAPGWGNAGEQCGGEDTAWSEGWIQTEVGSCQSWPFPNGDPEFVDTGYAYVQGWRKTVEGYVWPNYHDTTRRYQRFTGTRSFAPPAPRVEPVPDPAWPIPLISPRRAPLPLRPRPQRVTAPPLEPWSPSHAPLERPLNDPPLEVPFEFTKDLPTHDPDGDPVRGPYPPVITQPFEDAEEWNRALPGPGPGPRPGPWPGPLSGRGPERAPWQRANSRIIASPERKVRRNTNYHNTLPPYRGTVERKPMMYARTAAMLAKYAGKMTEGCDFIDAAFEALPLGIQQQYDSTKFLRGKPLSSASDDFAGKAGHGAGSSSSPGRAEGSGGGEGSRGGNSNTAKSGYSANRQYSGRAFAQKRKAFNDKQKTLPPWARAKWGRKSCAARGKAVYDNFGSLDDKKFIKNIIGENLKDTAWGIAGEGATSNAKQTGRPTGWVSGLGRI